jgi:hypothetical protein
LHHDLKRNPGLDGRLPPSSRPLRSPSGEREELQSAHQAFDIIFELLDHIDDVNRDILFFADEGGSWALGIEWEKVLPGVVQGPCGRPDRWHYYYPATPGPRAK